MQSYYIICLIGTNSSTFEITYHHRVDTAIATAVIIVVQAFDSRDEQF